MAAGCAPGLVHHYFPVNSELLGEALRHVLMADQNAVFAEVEQLVDADALAALRVLISHWVLDRATDYGLLWLDAWSTARRQDAIRTVVDLVMRAGHQRVVRVLDAGVAQRVFRTDDTARASWLLLAALDGVIIDTSLDVTAGLVDVRTSICAVVEQQLGLAPGSLAL